MITTTMRLYQIPLLLWAMLTIVFSPVMAEESSPATNSGQSSIAPSAAAIQQVVTYYQQGNTPILTKQITCKNIGEVPPMRFECVQLIDLSNPLPRFSERYFWVSLLVPIDYKKMLEFRFIHEGKVVDSTEISVSPSLRYRLWKFLPTYLPGNWKVALLHTNNEGKKSIIAEAHYQVQ